MLNTQPPVAPGEPQLPGAVEDQVITTVAAIVHRPHSPATSSSARAEMITSTITADPPTPAQQQLPYPRIDRVAAALVLGLTVACFAFLAYLITIDKTDLTTGVPATMAIVLTLNSAVFGTRNWVQRTRRTAATAGRVVVEALDPGSNP
ncbi:hypothetical protein [Nocardia bovistercoris]|uniref:Uncharacterized protein n=1 Tax=Nocardia bovistercoris TaxID=2785916 RepID=A0A931N644_9NOCA|nr:hypothetical protein [Nocardia bovistercoris]MBH0780096.1 hypothetical protein [Nocardia bovistercoris]